MLNKEEIDKLLKDNPAGVGLVAHWAEDRMQLVVNIFTRGDRHLAVADVVGSLLAFLNATIVDKVVGQNDIPWGPDEATKVAPPPKTTPPPYWGS